MDRFGGSDGGEVAVALIGEDHAVGHEALQGCCHGGSASVGGFDPVDVDIVVGEDGAADRGDADGVVGQAHLFENFGNEFVDYAVAAARAVVHIVVGDKGGFARYLILRLAYFFACHFCEGLDSGKSL